MNYKESMRHIKAFVFDVDGVFTDGLVLAMPDGDLLRQHNSKDGYALRRAVEQGYKVGIISGGASDSIRRRFALFDVSDVYLSERQKIEPFKEFCDKYNLRGSDVLVMGDDIPDIPMLKLAGCACCPADAAQEVKDICAYISYQKGGDGCVRDIIEQTLRLHEKWITDGQE
jgi:3-deoxy-D-manno-octulosonate 8-phosphate phosphatase (KDO 8-P phosphatase)